MSERGNNGPLPFRLRDFLSSAYYAISITGVLIGLIVWTVTQQQRIKQLEEYDQEHPTRRELADVAIKVENRITGLEKHVEDLDINGTRALAGRTILVEQTNRAQDERIQELGHRMNEMQVSVNKINTEIAVIVDRQNTGASLIRDLQQRLATEERRAHGP